MKYFALIAAMALTVAGCANTGGTSTPSSTLSSLPAYAAPAPRAAAAIPAPASIRTTARGAFVGDGSHVSSGTAEVFRDAEGWKIKLGPDFRLDGGPDPKVALGNGNYVPGTILGRLASLNGEQVYALKPGLDIGDYTQVYIWCEQFNVPLAHANLTLL